LLQASLNFAKLKSRGVDTEIAYRRNIEGFGLLSTRFTYTHFLQKSSFLNPVEPNRENPFLRELGDPRMSLI
jgi:hypothetical protein